MRAASFMLTILAGCHNSQTLYVYPRVVPFSGLPQPTCVENRPPANEHLFSDRRHACWKWGAGDVRSLSSSCRIDAGGGLDCWVDNLRQIPRGKFVYIDDSGYDACAIREDGTVSCWGQFSRSKVHDWSSTPSDTKFHMVSVGLSRSPYSPFDPARNQYACGVSDSNSVICWENGPDGHVFRLPGRYRHVEAGNLVICAITVIGNLECWKSGKGTGLIEKDATVVGPFTSVSLGSATGCALDHVGFARCWGHEVSGGLIDRPKELGTFSQMRAGGEHACGVREDGAVDCVGFARPPPAVRFSYISRPSGITNNYCGRSIDGDVYCWGDPSPDP